MSASYLCIVFHGIRFKVREDWLSWDNQFFCFIGSESHFHSHLTAFVSNGLNFPQARLNYPIWLLPRSYRIVSTLCADRKNCLRREFLFAPWYFSLSPWFFLLSAQIFFVTNFLTCVTNFVTRITNFVTSVTNFVTKNFKGEMKIFKQIMKTLLADRNHYLSRK